MRFVTLVSNFEYKFCHFILASFSSLGGRGVGNEYLFGVLNTVLYVYIFT